MTEDFFSEIKGPSGALKWYCDGEWRESISGKAVAITDPTTRQKGYDVQGAPGRRWTRRLRWRRCAEGAGEDPTVGARRGRHRAAALLRENAQPIADCR